MSLTGKQTRHLRGLAHHLDPVVLVGQHGLTDALHAKVSTELERHELIKVRIGQDVGKTAKEVGPVLAERAGGELVQTIGRMVVLYRGRKKDPEIVLPS